MMAALAEPWTADAHRLDELLQATRISVGAQTIDLQLDLSPGVDVAGAVVGAIDANGDGQISSGEADAYAAAVVRALVVSVDHQPVTAHLTRRELPSIDEMRQGVGTMRLVATAAVPPGGRRRHLVFTNRFDPGASVYLVNALVPADRRVRLGDPRRDALQRTFTLDYEVAGSQAWAGWSGVAIAMIATLIVGRSRRLAANRLA